MYDSTRSVPNRWKITIDLSVSINRSMEIASPILFGVDGLFSLVIVSTAMRHEGCETNFNCGVHVHIDARQLQFVHVKNICKNWIQYERVIAQFFPEARRGCLAAQYISSVDMITNDGMYNNIDRSRDYSDLIRFISNHNRNVTLNVNNLKEHQKKTLEFRMHPGTLYVRL
jgi:hypothetical protein